MTFAEHARRWLREPLVHFLIAGMAVFLFSAWRGEDVDPESRRITIDEDQVSRLVAAWEQTWQRPPTQAEIDGLIRDSIREEIYYREARRLGLDEDDTVIRRRLRSKMEFLATAEIENATPGDAVLQAWFDRNPARYARDVRYSFDQIYLGADAQSSAAPAILARLGKGKGGKGEVWQRLGQPISLPATLDNADRTEIAKVFGAQFADALGAQKPGGWTGPVASGFGNHLVRIRQAKAASVPRLAEIRQQVENDWRAATMEARKAQAYQTLLDGYTIRIAKP